MNQAELNKKAMADIFAIEDSKDLFESIGALNDDKAFGDPAVGDQGGEYGPDDMLTVIPGSTDPFAGQSITSQAQQEPSADDKRFAVDRLAELMANDHKTVVNPTEIDSYSPIIQKEVGHRMNVNQFLTDAYNDANQRLAAQNVSEAQPEGAVSEDIVPPEAEQAAAGTPEMAPGMAPEMTPAEGGIAPEPSLDANVGEDPLAGGEDLGLGAIGDDAGFDGFGAEEPAPEGDGLGLDAIGDEGDLGLGGEEPAAEGDGLGLDGIPAEGDEGIPAEGDEGIGGDEGAEPAAEDDALAGDTNLDKLSDDELGGDEGTEGEGDGKGSGDDEEKIPSGEDDADFEAEMAENRAILESIYKKYTEDVARSNVRSIVEAHMRRRQEDKKAMLESQTAAMKKEQELDAKQAEMREALGKKVEGLVEAADEKKAEAILESAAKAYAKAVEAKQAEKKAASEGFKARLESISANYHKLAKKEAARKSEEKAADDLKARLESILDKSKPLTESAAAPAKEPTLEERLEAIVKSAG